MTIVDSRHQIVWKAGGIKPTRDKTISVMFKSRLFRQGNYVLTLQGVAADHSLNLVEEYSFKVNKL